MKLRNLYNNVRHFSFSSYLFTTAQQQRHDLTSFSIILLALKSKCVVSDDSSLLADYSHFTRLSVVYRRDVQLMALVSFRFDPK